MPVTRSDIINSPTMDLTSLQRIAHRKRKVALTIIEPNPLWAQRFQVTKAHIQDALGPTAVSINHIGSTSVPNLPAKNIIDIDLVVADVNEEPSYIPALEILGFTFLFREPGWYGHRFLVDEDNHPDSCPINLHVFGPDCAEVERHRIFREWLVGHPEDLELYAKVKRECAAVSGGLGEGQAEYTVRKGGIVKEILERAFKEAGLS